MAERMDWSQFWPYYLQEHSDERNRLLHVIGTSIAFLLLVALVATRVWWILLLGLFIGYAFAWAGHAIFQKNRPATFQYPIKSFVSDWRMWFLFITGRLRAELKRYEIE